MRISYSGHATEWTGYIGLIYPSDYGYATSGGSTTNRNECLNTSLYNWNGANVSDCKNNDWLYLSSSYQWTLMPGTTDSNAFNVSSEGLVYASILYVTSYATRPVLYLDSKVEITGGDGTQNNPYELKMGN